MPCAQDAAALGDCAVPPGLSPPVGLLGLGNFPLVHPKPYPKSGQVTQFGPCLPVPGPKVPNRLASMSPRGGWSAVRQGSRPTARKRTLDAIGVTLMAMTRTFEFRILFPGPRLLRADRPEGICPRNTSAARAGPQSATISQINPPQNLEHFIQHADIPESKTEFFLNKNKQLLQKNHRSLKFSQSFGAGIIFQKIKALQDSGCSRVR